MEDVLDVPAGFNEHGIYGQWTLAVKVTRPGKFLYKIVESIYVFRN